jgi:hypothetical protein
VEFSRQRNAPVYAGEFGAVWFANPQDRTAWHRFVAQALSERNIVWSTHEYAGGGFGFMFNTLNGPRDLNADLNVDLLRALGFNPPPQTATAAAPRAAFTIYDDAISADCYIGFSYHGNAVNKTDFRNTTAADGSFSIRWGNASQYESTAIYFKRTTDLSQLVSQGYALEFKVRADRAVSFDVRFMNPESANSPPWRMKYTVNITSANQWQTIRVPLRNMEDQGAWSILNNAWVNSRGAFSWSRVIALEFAPEHHAISNVWFDSIKIVAP